MRWHSTPESVQNGEPTWLAILETVGAVILYWGVAWWFDTHVHLLGSICAAPLLLLRSPASTEKGEQLFMAYWKNKTKITPRKTPWRFGLIVLASSVAGFACAYLLSFKIVLNYQGSTLLIFELMAGMATMWSEIALVKTLSRSRTEETEAAEAAADAGTELIAAVIAAVVTITIAISTMVPVAKLETTSVEVSNDSTSVRTEPVAIKILSKILNEQKLHAENTSSDKVNESVRKIEAIPKDQRTIKRSIGVIREKDEKIVKLAAVVATIAAIAAASLMLVARKLSGIISEIYIMILFEIPSALGIWPRSLAVRFASILRHPLQGIISLPFNWRSNSWSIDSYCMPELIPGLQIPPREFSFKKNVDDFRAGRERLMSAIFILIFFLPAFFYRLSLKSTCWFYLPLMYLVTGRVWTHESVGDGPETLVVTVRDWYWEKTRRWLAGIVIVNTLVITYSAQRWGEVHTLFPHAPVPVYLWAFDLFNLAPWQLFSLISAVLTFIIFYFSDKVYLHWVVLKEKNPQTNPEPRHIHHLKRLLQLRTGSTIVFQLLAFGYVVLSLLNIDPHNLRNWLFFLDVVYGPYLP